MLSGRPPFYGNCGRDCDWDSGGNCQFCQVCFFLASADRFEEALLVDYLSEKHAMRVQRQRSITVILTVSEGQSPYGTFGDVCQFRRWLCCRAKPSFWWCLSLKMAPYL